MAIPPASTTPPPPPSPPANTGTILQLPPALGTAQTGQVLEGLIAERLAGARVLIQTSSGALILRTRFPLPLNTAVTLRITAGGPQPLATIVPRGQITTPAPGAAVTTPAPAAPGRPTGAVGTLVTATILRGGGAVEIGVAAPTANRGPASALVSNLAPGTRLTFRILSVTPPGTALPTGATAGTAGTATAAATATRGAAAATGPTLAATVTGTNAAGQTVIQAGGLELALATARPLPVGGNLLLGAIPLPDDGIDPQSLALARRWEALSDALRPGNLSTVRSLVSNSIPQPGVQLAGTLLFFLSALRAGDLRGWLGQDAARLLERGGALDRLGDEFSVMQRLATEPAGQDWRLFLIPFLSNEQLHQMRFFVRDDSSGTEDTAPAGIRFIIEVTFTRLGPFQFDGLVRDKSMDLIIRTELALAETARRDIATIYGDTLAALGYTGGVAIRTESFFDIQPLQEAGLGGKPGVIV